MPCAFAESRRGQEGTQTATADILTSWQRQVLPEASAAVENSPWRKLWLQEEKCQDEQRASPSPPEGGRGNGTSAKGSTTGGQSSHRSMPGELEQEPEAQMIDPVVGFLLGDSQSNRRCWLMLRAEEKA